MSKRLVIRYTQIPAKPPSLFSVVVWLLLDRCQPPGWVHGVVWSFVALMWLSFIVSFFWQEETRDVKFEEKS